MNAVTLAQVTAAILGFQVAVESPKEIQRGWEAFGQIGSALGYAVFSPSGWLYKTN